MTLNQIRNFALVFMLASAAAFGQTALSSTTLSAAIDRSTLTIPVTSASGMAVFANAGQAQGAIGSPITQNAYVLYVDQELIIINAINTTANTLTGSRRGAQGTKAVAHNSGARVFFGIATAFTTTDQTGSCTNVLTSSGQYLPRFNTTSGNGFYCPNIAQTGNPVGQWVWSSVGTMSGAPGVKFNFGCLGTAGSAETEYLDFGNCSGQTTAALGRQVVANTGTIYNLRVSSSAAAVGGTGKSIVTIFKNGTATTLTCQIVATALVCNDTVHGFPVVPGDYLYAQFVSASSESAANLAVSFDLR